MFTAVQLYYLRFQSEEAKTKFKNKVRNDTGISESTFYRILQNEPGKMLKEYLSQQTGIEISKLYQTIDPTLTLTLNPTKK